MPAIDTSLFALIGIGIATGLFFLWSLGKLMPVQGAPADEGSKYQHRLIFLDRELIFASQQINETINLDDVETDAYHSLITRLSCLFSGFENLVDQLDTILNDVEISERTIAGPMCLRVSRQENRLQFDISGIQDPLAPSLIVAHDAYRRDCKELDMLRDVVRRAPIAIWRETAFGEIDYSNPFYNKLQQDRPENDLQGKLFPSAPVTAPGDAPIHRRSRLDHLQGENGWFEVSSFASDDSCIHFGTSITNTVRAEESLRQFTRTLTQTFASLPIGLAIFDRARQLAVFNPSLVELTSLNPAWLSARPTLRDFLDKLREARMVPERKDFSDWRARMEDLEKSARQGTYCETWTLPSGQTYRVTGRPHPEGGLAFVFEDISAEISLTRKFRQELELSRALFDSLSEAIAIFQPNGEMVMANAAYAQLWDMNPDQTLGQTTVIDATVNWRKKCKPTPIWGDLRDYIATKSERSEWQAQIELTSGREVSCRFMPLSGGLTLVGFLESPVMLQALPVPRKDAALAS